MRRKLGKKNIVLFLIFSIIVGCIVFLFAFQIYKTITYEKLSYEVAIGSFIYDKDYQYIKTEQSAVINKKVDDNYYLVVNNNQINLGSYALVYNENDAKIYLYGESFLVKYNGEIEHYTKSVEIQRGNQSQLYKLADRKYLVVSKSIQTTELNKTYDNYLVVEIDKKGNALLLNNETNIRVISTINLITDDFIFDVANERLKVDGNVIDLKKINGSTNEYSSIKKDNPSSSTTIANNNDDNNNNNPTNNITNNNNYNNNYNNTINNNDNSNNNSNDTLNIVKKAILTSVNSSSSFIDVQYSIYDPKSEFISVYLLISGEGISEPKKIYLDVTSFSSRIRGLSPNSQYIVSFGYSYKDSETEEIIDEIANVVYIQTTRVVSTIEISKITSSSIYFNVKYDSNYACSTSQAVLVVDGVEVDHVVIDTKAALTSAGDTKFINYKELGYEVEIKIIDCVFNGEKVDIDVSTKFINR